MKKVIIVGSGPAGISASLYLQRSGRFETVVIYSGSSSLEKAEKIENYYGFAEPVSGKQLYENGIAGAKRLGVSFICEEVVSLEYDMDMHPVVHTEKGSYTADAVILATGSVRRSVPIPGVHEFEGRGVSYCAVCDAFFYRGRDVCVIGNGEYALHEAQTLAAAARSVTILTNGLEMSASLTEGISADTRRLRSIDGNVSVTGVTFEDGDTLSVSGVFMAVGVAGSAEFARKVGAETENGKIKVNDKMETSLPGLYAAGDCTGGTLQIYKAVYEGAAAAMSIIKNAAVV